MIDGTSLARIIIEKSKDVSKFWRSYQEAVEASGVPEAAAEWYVRWARKFAISVKGKPLRTRSAEEAQLFWADAFGHSVCF